MSGKVESKTTSTRIGPTSADLFDFEQTASSTGPGPRICRVIPVAPVGSQDVLILLGRVRWPGVSPLASAVAAALAEKGLPPTELTDGHSQGSDRWHLIPRQGIDGKVGEFDVLVGTAEFLEDAGIPLPDAIRSLLVDHERQGWLPVLIGACRTGRALQESRRSLIGIISIEQASRPPDPGFRASRAPGRPPSLLCDGPPIERRLLARRLAQRLASLLTPRRLCVAGLILFSAFAGLWFSALIVRPDEVAVVQRLGRAVTLLQPGLHVRPCWPFGRITRIQPEAIRSVNLGNATVVRTSESEQPADGLMLSGDVWPAEAVSSQAASSPPTDGYVRSASQLLRVRARVQYSIADIDAFLFNIRDPDALVASTADSVLRAMIGARSASVCLGPGRATIAEQATRVLQEKLDGMGGGIAIIAVLLDAIESVDGNSPEQSPDPIADRIEQGITTQADGDRLVAAARARSLEIVAAAEQDRDRRVRESQRLLDEVRAMAPAYARDPDGTRRRLLIELANGLPGGAKQLRQVLAETMSPSRRPAATQPGGGR